MILFCTICRSEIPQDRLKRAGYKARFCKDECRYLWGNMKKALRAQRRGLATVAVIPSSEVARDSGLHVCTRD
jgi:hypothetical protein